MYQNHFYCETCRTTISGFENWEQHKQGRPHKYRKKIERNLEGVDRKPESRIIGKNFHDGRRRNERASGLRRHNRKKDTGQNRRKESILRKTECRYKGNCRDCDKEDHLRKYYHPCKFGWECRKLRRKDPRSKLHRNRFYHPCPYKNCKKTTKKHRKKYTHKKKDESSSSASSSHESSESTSDSMKIDLFTKEEVAQMIQSQVMMLQSSIQSYYPQPFNQFSIPEQQQQQQQGIIYSHYPIPNATIPLDGSADEGDEKTRKYKENKIDKKKKKKKNKKPRETRREVEDTSSSSSSSSSYDVPSGGEEEEYFL